MQSPAPRIRRSVQRKTRQALRLSKKSLQLLLMLCGAALVALVSIGFAMMADYALEKNREWTRAYPYLIWLVMPLAFVLLRWCVMRYAPYSAGSGIPQVIASLSLHRDSPGKLRLVSLAQAIWKIPLTFLGLLAGASIGREGPSVQIGAAAMLAWGQWCQKIGLPLKGFNTREWIAAGAAGGLAAAFNAPLSGVIFAIEEIGKGLDLRWQRLILLGVLAAGFIVVALTGDNPYFGTFHSSPLHENMLFWALLCAAVCGVAGGIFARLLSKGLAGCVPSALRHHVHNHPLRVAALMGLVVAFLGYLTAGGVFGTSYDVAKNALMMLPQDSEHFSLAKLLATVASYWAGIPGGIFTPALTTGAGIGVQLAHSVNMQEAQSVFVLICMAAFLAASTQSPVTASVIVMEMSGSQAMLFWMLLTSLVATVVSKQICPQAFYHYSAGRFRQLALSEDARQAAAPARTGY
ncbi:chloride channel protein [Advenella kashmirensis]